MSKKQSKQPYQIMAGPKFLNDLNSAMDSIAKGPNELRRTGRTTRLVDLYIQKIFTEFNIWIYISDHHDGLVKYDNKHIWKIFIMRIQMEHSWLGSGAYADLFIVDKDKYRVKMIMDPKKLAQIKEKLKG